MLPDLVLKCPVCQTDDYLYATPTKHCVHIECEECKTQFVIPNDGGEKVADNLLVQHLTSVPDTFFVGYLGLQSRDDEETYWSLSGIVSEEKREKLDEQLQRKVEMLSKLETVTKVEYKINEYSNVDIIL